MSAKATFVFDIWYFAGLSTDVKRGKMVRREIAGEAMTVGRRDDGSVFAMRDVCPHRAAPFSAGCIKDGTVECPYHGWRFGIEDGACKEIPALTSEQPMEKEGQLIWVYIASDKRFAGTPPIDPPSFPFATRKATMDDGLIHARKSESL